MPWTQRLQCFEICKGVNVIDLTSRWQRVTQDKQGDRVVDVFLSSLAILNQVCLIATKVLPQYRLASSRLTGSLLWQSQLTGEQEEYARGQICLYWYFRNMQLGRMWKVVLWHIFFYSRTLKVLELFNSYFLYVENKVWAKVNKKQREE